MTFEADYSRFRRALQAWAASNHVQLSTTEESDEEGYEPHEPEAGETLKICCVILLLKAHQQDNADSVFVLAHELGHHLWFCVEKRTRWDADARARADSGTLSRAEAEQYFAEEVGAWDLGWAVLEGTGFSDEAAYRAHADVKLANYRRALLP